MTIPRVDTNVLIRYLADEPSEQAERVGRFFEQIEDGVIEVWLEDVVLAEVVWVLSSVYHASRDEIVAGLLRLLGSPSIKVRDKPALRTTLTHFRDRNVDFVDALLAAQTVSDGGTDIYSFDRDFDKLPGINRIEPE
jgi:predicted nucleic-acid-binding protein